MNATSALSTGAEEEDQKWHVDITVDNYTASVAGVGFAVGVVVTLFAVFVVLKIRACRRRHRQAASSKEEAEDQDESDREGEDRDLV